MIKAHGQAPGSAVDAIGADDAAATARTAARPWTGRPTSRSAGHARQRRRAADRGHGQQDDRPDLRLHPGRSSRPPRPRPPDGRRRRRLGAGLGLRAAPAGAPCRGSWEPWSAPVPGQEGPRRATASGPQRPGDDGVATGTAAGIERARCMSNAASRSNSGAPTGASASSLPIGGPSVVRWTQPSVPTGVRTWRYPA